MRIPGDFGMMPPVDSDGKPRGSNRARRNTSGARSDVIEFSVNGKRLSADITSRRAGAAGENDGLDSGARSRVERRLTGGFYEREEVLVEIADKLLDLCGI